MSTNRDRTASTDHEPDHDTPSETVVGVTTDDGLVIYDDDESDAWITSTVGVDLSDVC